MVAMEVAAPKATEDPRDGMARRNDRVAASQTVVQEKLVMIS